MTILLIYHTSNVITQTPNSNDVIILMAVHSYHEGQYMDSSGNTIGYIVGFFRILSASIVSRRQMSRPPRGDYTFQTSDTIFHNILYIHVILTYLNVWGIPALPNTMYVTTVVY